MNQNKKCKAEAPLAVFDAGPGGLAVVKFMMEFLPSEDILYLGDTARQPYGPQPAEKVRQNTLECCRWLYAQGVKAILIGCNTASVAALDAVKAEITDIPVIGMIDAGVRGALREKDASQIGVWGTELTVCSHAYKKAILSEKPHAKVIEAAPITLLRLAELGQINDKQQISKLVDDYLQPFAAFDMDALIFGCTDLTCVEKETRDALGQQFKIIDPGREAVIEARSWLQEAGCLNLQDSTGRTYDICITGQGLKEFTTYTREFLGLESISVRQIRVK